MAESPGAMRTATGFRKFALPPHRYICLYHVCLFSILYLCSARAINKIFEDVLAKEREYDQDSCIADVEDSAQRQLSILEKLTPADSGSFMHWDGRKVCLYNFILNAQAYRVLQFI